MKIIMIIILLIPIWNYGKINIGVFNIPSLSYEDEEIVEYKVLNWFEYSEMSETNHIFIDTSKIDFYIDTSLNKYLDVNLVWIDSVTSPSQAISQNSLEFLYDIKFTSLVAEDDMLVLISTYKLYDSEGAIISSDVFKSVIYDRNPNLAIESLLVELATDITKSISLLAINIDFSQERKIILSSMGKNKFPFELVKNNLYTIKFSNGRTAVFEVLNNNSKGIELFDSEEFINKSDQYKILDIQPSLSEEILDRKIQRFRDKNQAQQRKKLFGF